MPEKRSTYIRTLEGSKLKPAMMERRKGKDAKTVMRPKNEGGREGEASAREAMA